MRTLLEERDFPVSQVRFFASARSAGTTLPFKGEDVTVEDSATADFAGIDIALFSNGGAASRELAPRVAAAGATVIDNSSAWRKDPDVPLVVSEVNPGDLDDIPKGIVANPNCTTMAAMPVLAPLHERAGLVRLHVSSYQAVRARAGSACRSSIASSRARMPRATPPGSRSTGARWPSPRRQLYAVPSASTSCRSRGRSSTTARSRPTRSRSCATSRAGSCMLPDLRVSGTCVRVPVFTGHSLAIHAEFADDLSPEEALDLLRTHPASIVTDVPNPLEAAGRDEVFVGRVRADQAAPEGKGLVLFVVGDNLRKGAALNAVQIAEELVKRR